jgi:hypothetical protein
VGLPEADGQEEGPARRGLGRGEQPQLGDRIVRDHLASTTDMKNVRNA